MGHASHITRHITRRINTPPLHHTGQHRHVDYAAASVNGSQVPAEWQMWLTQTTDVLPEPQPKMEVWRSWMRLLVCGYACDPCALTHAASFQRWQARHSENKTGTADAYIPCSTTRPKIAAWDPANPSGKP